MLSYRVISTNSYVYIISILWPSDAGSQQTSHWSVHGFLMHIVQMLIFLPRRNPMGPNWKTWYYQMNCGPRRWMLSWLVVQELAPVALHLIIQRWENWLHQLFLLVLHHLLHLHLLLLFHQLLLLPHQTRKLTSVLGLMRQGYTLGIGECCLQVTCCWVVYVYMFTCFCYVILHL